MPDTAILPQVMVYYLLVLGESDHHRNVLDCSNALLCILILQLQAPRAPNNGSGIGQLLRDPDHYEEINVIGNGETNEEDYGDCLSDISNTLSTVQ